MVRQPSPVMTQHARDRCREMGISTKVAKRIWRNQVMTYPGTDISWGTQATIVVADCEPDYLIVVVDGYVEGAERTEGPTVVTVAFRTDQPYIRQGETFRHCTPEEYAEHKRLTQAASR